MEENEDKIYEQIAKSFSEMSLLSTEFAEQADKLLNNIVANHQLKVVQKYLNYIEKFSKSSFITRWYWRIKIKKMKPTFDSIIFSSTPIPNIDFSDLKTMGI